MKKVLLAMASAFALTTLAFADKVSYKAFNKMFMEDAFFYHANDEYEHDFPALKNEVYAELLTDKIDAMIDAYAVFDDLNGKDFGFVWDVESFDWYVELRPFSHLTLGFHDNIFAKGSYLPVWDDNIASGDIGSDGTTLVFSQDKLRLAVTFPFGDSLSQANYLKDDEDDPFNFGVGAIYDATSVQVGATIQDVINKNRRTFGMFVSTPDFFTIQKGFTFNAGITSSETIYGCKDVISLGPVDASVAGDFLTNFGLGFNSNGFKFAIDLLTNFVEDNTYDLYTGLSVDWTLEKTVGANITVKVAADFSDDYIDLDNAYEFMFNLYKRFDKKQTAGVGFDGAICGSTWAVAMPVYWKYYF